MTDPAEDDAVIPAKIPSDVAREDRILGPLTARQTAILAVTVLVLYGGFWATRPLMAPVAYLALVTPIALVVTVVAVGRRDGIGMDQLLLAGVRFHRAPKRHVPAPEGVDRLPTVTPPHWSTPRSRTPAALDLPVKAVTDTATLDLARDGHAALAVCSTVNFHLRTGGEQQALTEAYARWLNSLTGPTQILVRAHRLDTSALVSELSATAPALPHPALERAARAHADFLNSLATERDLLTRHVLIVAREPAAAGAARAGHRLNEAARTLEAAEITVSPLGVQDTAAALRTSIDPESTTTLAGAPC
ncbi:PrgI family protein [Streptomyces triticagri]|uniref:PrgI family protein n=1 Tax=Streptomyces triticagri TaxID=2293568 RepID=A0A372MBM1_9ACTN|nr:PrgI family protein [Streptomyces triticagri]RFU88289.1 PrgI family protein [Streptomyces triticagri]